MRKLQSFQRKAGGILFRLKHFSGTRTQRETNSQQLSYNKANFDFHSVCNVTKQKWFYLQWGKKKPLIVPYYISSHHVIHHSSAVPNNLTQPFQTVNMSWGKKAQQDRRVPSFCAVSLQRHSHMELTAQSVPLFPKDRVAALGWVAKVCFVFFVFGSSSCFLEVYE